MNTLQLKLVLVAERIVTVEIPEGEVPETVAAHAQQEVRNDPIGFIKGDKIEAKAMGQSTKPDIEAFAAVVTE